VFDLSRIRGIHPAHAIPPLAQAILLFGKVMSALGIAWISTHVKGEVKFVVERLEEVVRRRPLDRITFEVNQLFLSLNVGFWLAACARNLSC
jgi:hypothetical protein